MSGLKRFVLATVLALSMATTFVGFGDGFGVPAAHAYAPPRATKQTSGSGIKYIGDMKPGSCLYQGGDWYLCQGHDNNSYACKSTGACTKLGS